MSYYTVEQQKFLTMFNFQHSQITQNEFEKLDDLLIKYKTVYATFIWHWKSKFTTTSTFKT